jgi:methionine-rich copper-binding protein CopC
MPLGLVVATAAAVGLLPSVGDRPLVLVSAEPADGTRVTMPPPAVSLTFSGELDPTAVHMVVVGPDTSPVSLEGPAVTGDTAIQTVEITDDGPFVVGYHVAARGGQEASGQYRFVVGTGPADPPAAIAPVITSDHDHGQPGLLATVVIVVLMAGGLGVLAMALWRRDRPGPPHRADRKFSPPRDTVRLARHGVGEGMGPGSEVPRSPLTNRSVTS